MNPLLKTGILASLALWLTACETPPPPEPEPVQPPPVVVERVPEPVVDTGPSDEIRRAMYLADMLFAAVTALEDNRLMPPVPNNAYDQFRAVLDFAPDNAVALKGMSDIVRRYVDLADNATRVGQFDQSATYLNQASRIGREDELIAAARSRLQEARETETELYPLDPEELTAQSTDILLELGEIGQRIHRNDARFLITARSDEEGRWIYRIMREAIGGERLRGNIAIGSEPAIRVTLPGTN